MTVGSKRVVVVGAGLAGAATARALVERGLPSVTLVEQEGLPGRHATSQNAAMLRQVVGDPEIAALAREGARFILERARAGELDVKANGSLFLAEGARWERLRAEAALAREHGVPAEEISLEEAVRRVPVLSGARFDGAVFTATDGVVDVANLLELYLRRARAGGAELRLETRATGPLIEAGRVRGVATDRGDVEAEAVVVAGGAWSGQFVPPAPRRPPLTAKRRHIYVTGPLPWVDPEWPIVWNLSAELYFRPEAPGLLLCPCDEDSWPAGTPPVEPEVTVLLANLLEAWVPALRDVPIARVWAGLRTFAPDRRFRLGADAELPGLYWAAALGGHGVTCSAAAGRVSAEAVLAGLAAAST